DFLQPGLFDRWVNDQFHALPGSGIASAGASAGTSESNEGSPVHHRVLAHACQVAAGVKDCRSYTHRGGKLRQRRGQRKTCMFATTACWLIALASLEQVADAPALEKKTYTYKTVGDTKIEADVYRPNDATARPVLVWIHGGALIMGSRSGVPRDLLDLCR